MALKGKEIVRETPPLKRKGDHSDKSGNSRKRTNPGVLQFFDVAADVDEDDDDDSDSDESSEEDDFEKDFMEEVTTGQNEKSAFGKTHNVPFLPKEEELSADELEMLVKERYKPGSKYVTHAYDQNKTAGSGEVDSLMSSVGDPIIWRVKCTVGRERRTVFCLIQKFVDLQSLGNKLKTASAFAPDHIKGYIYIEAEREFDVVEACKGLTTVYTSRISSVSKNEIAHLFAARNTGIDIPQGTWVRVKHGNYRGDLAQVVKFDDIRKKATVKIIPRIDLQVLARKLAGEGTTKQAAIPVARVISSKDLEEFRPHIKLKRDRQTEKVFETICDLKLKDGYLYKKVSIESISYVDVVPSADELLKFKPYKKDASDDAEWLSHLYGEQKKKRLSECSKGTAKGLEGTSETKKGNDFQLHDLVSFGPKDFGVIIGVESDSFQILKYDEVQGAEVLSLELHEITGSSFDKKFTTMDHRMKATSIRDTVRVLEGPFTGRQGVIKHICRGIIFIYDENQLETGGYFCAKSQSCEKISHSNDTNHESSSDVFGTQGFEDIPASPKSPQSSKKPWQEKENAREFNGRREGDRDGAFSVGQSLRIRVGPLKGHLCRVVAIYRSDVTVKVDSQMKILSVKREHLSEVGVRSNFMKQSDGLGRQGETSGAQTESNGWNSIPPDTGRSSWPDCSSSDFLLHSSWKNPCDSLVTSDDPDKEKGDDPWGSRVTHKKTTDSWGHAAGSGETLEKGKEEESDPWGNKQNSTKVTDSWGNAGAFVEDTGKGKDVGDDSWGSKGTSTQAIDSWGNAIGIGGNSEKEGGDDPWCSMATTSKKSSDSWSNAVGFGEDAEKGKAVEDDAWGSKGTSKKALDSSDDAICSGGDLEKGKDGGDDPWGGKATGSEQATDSWGNAVGFGGNLEKDGGDDPWGGKATGSEQGTDSWGNAVGFGDDPGKDEGGDLWGSKQTQAKSTEGYRNITDSDCWGKGKGIAENDNSGWGSAALVQNTDTWHKGKSEAGKECGVATGTQDKWSSQKVAGGDRSFDWNEGSANEVGDTDNQHNSWNKPINFDGGRDSDGRRGRGGYRGGNRDRSGRGRSFGSGGSSNWGSNTPDSDSWGKRKGIAENDNSGWGSAAMVQSTDTWGKGKSEAGNECRVATGTQDNWSSQKVAGGDRSFDWNKGSANEVGDTDNQHNSWNKPINFDGGRDSDGRRGRGGYRGGNRDRSGRGRSFGSGGSSNWGSNTPDSDSWGKRKGIAENDNSGWGSAAMVQNTDTWGKGKSEAGNECRVATGTQDNWSSQKVAGGDRSFDWNKGSANEVGSTDNQHNSWNQPRNFDGGRGSGGRRGRGEFRGGNRGQSGRGRSFGRGGSSGWGSNTTDSDCSGKGKGITGNDNSGWGNAAMVQNTDTWGKGKSEAGKECGVATGTQDSDCWGKGSSGWGTNTPDSDCSGKGKGITGNGNSGWGSAAMVQNTDTWDKGKSEAGKECGVATGTQDSDCSGKGSSGWGSNTTDSDCWGKGKV
ncbi:hypothetical protein AQUCO_03800139v1 [Aquilegia coerulea]|uniref:KOW domain-containing protein n=1 Tax=Aquilegia coerulea TaxID=218851 RepID=A0A2G5CTW7_AQUCA|nr:hypothetical protein AQUCO_03800139v1 [Aquilegia coerulea]